jgi:hypothetical protein
MRDLSERVLKLRKLIAPFVTFCTGPRGANVFHIYCTLVRRARQCAATDSEPPRMWGIERFDPHALYGATASRRLRSFSAGEAVACGARRNHLGCRATGWLSRLAPVG